MRGAGGRAPGSGATRHDGRSQTRARPGGATPDLAGAVDTESGQVTLLGHWICHDSGRLINPLIVEGQIAGAVALGIGSVPSMGPVPAT